MKVTIDANVFVDVLQQRQPFYAASAEVLDRIAERQFPAVIPAHIVPTIYYVLKKESGKDIAVYAVDWVLDAFEVVPTTRDIMVAARSLKLPDFEDGNVAASAQTAACDDIVTRDLAGFNGSVVPAISPAELLSRLA